MITFNEAQDIINRLEFNLWRVRGNVSPEVFEYPDWWYFPPKQTIIGSCGIVIDKADGHYNVLGSAFHPELWLWGHARGFKHDTYDLIITEIRDRNAAEKFIRALNLRYPTVNAPYVRWYQPQQIALELSQPTPTFQDQRLGLKIPMFKEAEATGYFSYELVVRSCENYGCPA
jgi:hypothetical protein